MGAAYSSRYAGSSLRYYMRWIDSANVNFSGYLLTELFFLAFGFGLVMIVEVLFIIGDTDLLCYDC